MIKTNYIKRVLLGFVLSCLALPSSVLYAMDIRNGSIKVREFHKNEDSNLAKVTLQDAVAAATKTVPGKAIEAELESEDGFLVYEVKIVSPDKKVTEVLVDAGNSAILGTKKESKLLS